MPRLPKDVWIEKGKVVHRPTMDESVDILIEREQPPKMSENETLRIAREELRKEGVNFPVKIDRDMGSDPYSDATIFYGEDGKVRLHLHPFVQWIDPNYLRKVIRHEVSHYRTERKRRPRSTRDYTI